MSSVWSKMFTKQAKRLAISCLPPRMRQIDTRGMGLSRVWKNYRVLIVMGTGLGLIHFGWYYMQSNPIFQQKQEGLPDRVEYVMDKVTATKAK